MTTATGLRLENRYAQDLPGAWLPVQPAPAPAPRAVFINHALAAQLGLDLSGLDEAAAGALFTGQALPPGAQPIAQAYAGHQFGGFSPQLGDGRALLLGEHRTPEGRLVDIAFKGSGRTPFSRGGDGKAALGPMLREVLISESLHALGLPTTRSLAVATTGEEIWRDRPLPGAVLTRTAASHLRVGTFQFFAARGDREALQRLFAFTLRRHDPDLAAALDRGESVSPMALLRRVAERQARLVAQWLGIGFIHGVMNTDNMALSGESIDFGPCAFLEAYDPATVFSSIDTQGRYAFGRQASIARWNLARFAEALLPLAATTEAGGDDDPGLQAAVDEANAILTEFPSWLEAARTDGLRAKLGLATAQAEDRDLADAFLGLLQAHRVDHTLAWRRLADAAEGQANALRVLFGDEPTAPDAWLVQWQARCAAEDADAAGAAAARAERLRGTNPAVIPRNHRVEEALAAASEHGDLAPFERLLAALRQPWREAGEDGRPSHYAEAAPAAVTDRYRTFCGT